VEVSGQEKDEKVEGQREHVMCNSRKGKKKKKKNYQGHVTESGAQKNLKISS
jgi:hypothetical protein